MALVRKRIMVLDDDRSVLNLFELLFFKIGLSCETFLDPMEFVASLKKDGEPVLCYIDLNLSKEYKKEGFDLIRILRKYCDTDFGIIVVSKNNDPEDIDMAFKVGANEYLEKPIDPIIFEYQVARYIKGVNFQNPALAKVGQNSSSAEVLTQMNITHICEDYIIMHSEQLFAKKAILKLTNDTLSQIFGKDIIRMAVISSTPVDNGFLIHLKSISDNHDERLKIAKWIRGKCLDKINS